MDSSEEYFLRVLKRTSGGLTDSLIPAHGSKLTRLVERLESTPSLGQEITSLMNVQGFGKCALAMEWLLERTRMNRETFVPEQFESDILLLNEKLFEAFLNQPFDMPDYSRTFEAPARPIQNIQVSDDEFLGGAFTNVETAPEEVTHDALEPSEDNPWNPTLSTEAFTSALVSSTVQDVPPASEGAPSLRDSMSNELFEATERIAQNCTEFIDKTTMERPIATAVLRVALRAGLDITKSTSNLIAQDFYEAMLKLIATADEMAKVKSDTFADVIRDIGDRLGIALRQPSDGLPLLKNATKFLDDPKELLKK